MQMLRWSTRVLLVPAIGCALFLWWSAGEYARDGQHMSWWAAVFLFGGLACSWAIPRSATVALYGGFLLQLVRPVCRFDQEGWLAYAAIVLTAVVLAVRTEGAERRRYLAALLPLGILIGLFTNLPELGPPDLGVDGPPALGGFGLVNGKAWGVVGAEEWWEVVVGLLVWTVGAIVLIVAAWTIGSTVRARRLQWAAEAATDTARAELAESRYELRVTEERDRIAQDVHDITAHSLSVILAQADGAAAGAPDDTSRAALGAIAGSARGALTQIRTLLEHLEHPAEGDTGHSIADIEALVATADRSGATVHLEVHGDPRPVPAATGLAAYRIAQEALTNVLRHAARSGPVRCSLDWGPSGLALTVASPLRTDGGTAPARPGRGTVGMQQRARLVGGWLTHGPDAESGTYVVTAFLPAVDEALR